MKKSLAVLSVIGLGFATNVYAEDDVVVDLSVLGGGQFVYVAEPVQGASSILNLPPMEPQFPVVKKETKKPVVKKKPKSVPMPSVKPVKEVEPVVVEQKAVVIEVVEEKIEDPQAQPIVEKEEVVAEVVEVVAEEKAEELLVEEVVETPVANEVVEPVEEKTEIVAEEVVQAEILTVEDDERVSQEVSEVLENSVINEIEPIEKNQEETPLGRISDDEGSDLGVAATENLVLFDADSTELSEDGKAVIEKIVNGFEDVSKNKIGILSYNVDNDEDAFKRKKQSLVRATEVRSYLISLGYKNFSIKIVNVEEGADKANSVEILEVKR